jgi:hypothetical protein
MQLTLEAAWPASCRVLAAVHAKRLTRCCKMCRVTGSFHRDLGDGIVVPRRSLALQFPRAVGVRCLHAESENGNSD